MRLTAKPNIQPMKATTAAAEQYRKDLRAAAIYATNKASLETQRGVQERITSTGLGRLSRAVGQTSTARQRNPGGNNPYGVIFAKGGDDSLAGGALESYTRGSTIRPGPGKVWLAFPTAAVPRLVTFAGRRQRLTPEIYMKSGLMQSIGRLEFRPIGGNRAIWVVKKVTVSPKTGRAKAAAGRTRSRIPQKEIVAFVGIRVTRRAQRFDKDGVAAFYAKRVPGYMAEFLNDPQLRRRA